MHPAVSAFLSQRLIDRRGGHRRRVLDEFKARQRLAFAPREEIEKRQNEALALLLAHARDHVPHFKLLLAERSRIGAENAREILGALPLMRRSEIQENLSHFLAENAADAVRDSTGGSTGTPMDFWVDRDTQVAREASLFWADSLAGWRYGERIAMLWGSDRDVRAAMAKLRSIVRWRIENRRWYNAFEMTEADMLRFHREMTRFCPHLLVGYATSLFLFARTLRERGLRPRYPLRAIVTSAEVLDPFMRDQIEQCFGRPVFDRYGSREFGAIAAECPAHGGLHVNEADCLLEVLSEDPEREPGPIVVTYLRNFVMPFLRYDTGDFGVWASGTCSCGRGGRRLARVIGRQSDTLRTADGRLLHGEYFTHLLYGVDGIRAFQLCQERPDRYLLRVVAGAKARAQEAKWRSRIAEVLGAGSQLSVEYVDAIPVAPSGKHRFVVSAKETGLGAPNC